MARQINSGRFQPAEFRRVVYRAIIEHGHTIEDVLDPMYFVNVCQGVENLSLIECHWEDCSAFALLHVLYSSNSSVKVAKILHVEYDKASSAKPDALADDAYKIEFTGEHTKWRVVRHADKHELKTSLPSRKAAESWLADHKKAL